MFVSVHVVSPGPVCLLASLKSLAYLCATGAQHRLKEKHRTCPLTLSNTARWYGIALKPAWNTACLAWAAPFYHIVRPQRIPCETPCNWPYALTCMLCAVQGSWEAAENILNTIVLPPAIDDAGGAGSMNYDWTQVRPISQPLSL